MMRCFLPCFRASKRPKDAAPIGGGQTNAADGALEPTNQLTQQKTVEEPIDCTTESKARIEEQSNNNDGTTPTKELIKKETPKIRDHPDEQYKNIRLGEGHFNDNFVDHDFDGKKRRDKDEVDDEISKRLLQDESPESLFSLSIDSRKQVSSSESLFSLSIDSRKQVCGAEKAEIEVNSPLRLESAVCTRKEDSGTFWSSGEDKARRVSAVLNPIENLAHEKPSQDTGVRSSKKETKENMNEESSAKEVIKKLEKNKEEQGEARPWNPHSYRYRDCFDEGYEDINLDESNFDVTFADDDPHNENRGKGAEGADVNRAWVQEESSESLFSLSSDTRKRISAAEKVEDEEVNSLNVSNPIQNLTQGKVVKATVMQPLKNEKENINLVQNVDIPIISPEPSLKLSNRKARQKKFNDKREETGVDTSFSSWLIEPETTPISMKSTNSVGQHTAKGGRGSPLSHAEYRPILGALTIEELRNFSASTASSRRSRTRSPDGAPIIGSVGSYWSHTGQNMELDLSKSRKDSKLKWNSTALKARLETAFEASVAEA